ncbi:N-acetyltransferase [Clostridium sp. A1-XYC3]|uniref:N-acetyltransferase n=1 Tax=Clostridium tanneri TaxID=3037988 RepID=A0ABU4JUA5_9CLOT|nr:N-acetyltransferase [Clostridium sp. A1-XYC3]MDW8801727.1 N-acetyltransferase [Clostridium sp. A1-XYC3]
MIRELEVKDINKVMEVWKDATIEAHDFIDREYWLRKYNEVKDVYIPASKTFVYEENSHIKGFISILNNEFIGALFVDISSQGKGIGGQLIDFAKKRYSKLGLAVYKNNKKAAEFYKHKGFVLCEEKVDEDTNEKELIMKFQM